MIQNATGDLESGHPIDLYTDEYKGHLKGTVQSQEVRIGSGTFASAGAVGIHFWYPMNIKFYGKTDNGTLHIKHFDEQGNPLNDYDYTETLQIGQDHTSTYAHLLAYNYLGSTISYDDPPTEAPIENRLETISEEKTYHLTYDGTYQDAYITYYYRSKHQPKENQSEEEQSQENPNNNQALDPESGTIIKADNRGQEKYQVSEGIPVTEDLYAQVEAKSYLYDYTFTQQTGIKNYEVVITKTYYLDWEEDHGGYVTDEEGNEYYESDWVSYSDTETVTQSYTIPRYFSYWIIHHLEIFGLDKAIIENNALPNQSITLHPKGYTPPQVQITHSPNEEDHLIEPVEGTVYIDLGSESISGGTSRPSVPSENWAPIAEDAIGPIVVNNDLLNFNNTTIMTDIQQEEQTPAPGQIPESPYIDKNTLYEKEITIPKTVPNGEHLSTGNIHYTLIESINPQNPNPIIKEIPEINSITVHTPIICYPTLEAREDLNQQIQPEKETVLVLDEPFTIHLPNTGQHRNILGYGNNNYEKYIQNKNIKLSFDAYIGTNTTGKFLPKNTWHTLPATEESITLYIPTWATEGPQEILIKNQAINTTEGEEAYEYHANLDLNNYWAVERIPVYLQGRIHSFTITSTDDMNWQTFFRTTGSQHTGKTFHTGTKDPSGNPAQHAYYLPIMPTKNDEKGYYSYATKLGYKLHFNITTTGAMYDPNDYIEIIPKFYYIKNTGAGRQEIDLWYETGRTLVKIGSSQDTSNYTMTLNNPYRNIDKTELLNTASILYKKYGQQEKKSLQDYENKLLYEENTFIGRAYKLILDKNVRTYIGDTNNLPPTITEEKARESVQKWYGTYHLPNTTFAVPKGLDLSQYTSGINRNSDFVLKDGYILVEFQIKTINDHQNNGQPTSDYYVLDYIAPNCNQWETEGYVTKQEGLTLNFGDIILYYTDHKASDDYQVGR
jgi:hypothetical protein